MISHFKNKIFLSKFGTGLKRGFFGIKIKFVVRNLYLCMKEGVMGSKKTILSVSFLFEVFEFIFIVLICMKFY